jgi:CubicO group peptidase (beta-lactamase class C family)
MRALLCLCFLAALVSTLVTARLADNSYEFTSDDQFTSEASGPLQLEDLPPAWEQLIDAYITNMTRCQDLIGLSVSIVAANTSIYAKGFGTVSLDPDAPPVDADTLFAIGSTTKAFTSALLSILNDEDYFPLGWNTPVTAVAKDFSFADPSLNTHATILDLLSMRMGVSLHGLLMFKNDTRTNILYEYQQATSAFPLRQTFLYSNEMVTLAGHLAEIILGQPWEQLVQERLLTPLDMTRSSGNLTRFRLDSNRAMPYAWNPLVGNWTKLPENTLDVFENTAMAGGMSTSANEVARWLLLHINGGYDVVTQRQLVSRANMDLVHRPWMIMGSGPFPFVQPTAPFENSNLGYGMSWMEDRYRGHKVVWHNGEVFGFQTEMSFLPLDGLGIFLSQTGSYIGETSLFAIRAFITNTLLGLPNWPGLNPCPATDVHEAPRASPSFLHPKVDATGLGPTPAEIIRDRAAEAAKLHHTAHPHRVHLIAEKKRVHRSPISADLYVGVYSNSMYGTLTISDPSASEALAAFPDHPVSDAPVTLLFTWSTLQIGLSTYDGVVYNGTLPVLPYGLVLGLQVPNYIVFHLAPGQGSVVGLDWLCDQYQPPYFAKVE